MVGRTLRTIGTNICVRSCCFARGKIIEKLIEESRVNRLY